MFNFTLTTAQWIFCSLFAGLNTVFYMCYLFEKEKIEKEIEDEKFAQEEAEKFLDFLTKLGAEVEIVDDEEENNKEEEIENYDNN